MYSSTLLVVGPKQAPPEETSGHVGAYMTQAAKAKFQV